MKPSHLTFIFFVLVIYLAAITQFVGLLLTPIQAHSLIQLPQSLPKAVTTLTALTNTKTLPLTVTVTIAPTAAPLRLAAPWGKNCFYTQIEPVLEDAKQWGVPITPLPTMPSIPETDTCLPPPINIQATPTPVPNYVTRIGFVARLDAYALEAATYLEQHEKEGLEGLRQWLDSQQLLCKSTDPCPNTMAIPEWSNDNTLEYVIILSLPQINQAECGGLDSLPQRAYLLSCQSDPAFCSVYRIGRLWEDDISRACVNPVFNLNQEGYPELLVTYRHCGAADCFDQLEIVGVSGSSTYNYLAPKVEVNNGCISGRDEDGDGIVEILAATTDRPGSQGMTVDTSGQPLYGPYQEYVAISKWTGTSYALAGRAYTHQCLFHWIWDGIDWAKQGEWQTALTVFEMALARPDIPVECKSSDNIPFPWRSYAQFAVGMVNARLGRVNEAKTALLKAKEIDSDRIFSPLADTFLEAYNQGCYNVACDALINYVNTLPADAPFRGPYQQRQLTTFCSTDIK